MRALLCSLGEVRLQLLLFLLGRQVGEGASRHRGHVVRRLARVDHLRLVIISLIRRSSLAHRGVLVVLLVRVFSLLIVTLVDNPRRLVRARSLGDPLESGSGSGKSGREHVSSCARRGSGRGGSHLLLSGPSLLGESELLLVGDVGGSERVGVVVGGGEIFEGSGGVHGVRARGLAIRQSGGGDL